MAHTNKDENNAADRTALSLINQRSIITDGTDDANVTTGGSLDIQINELDSTVSSNSGTQLNVTRFDSAGVEIPGNFISVNNSRAASTLAAGAVFQGTGEDVSMYGRVGVAINSTNATDGVLTMEVSHDGVTWFGPTRTWADTSVSQPHMWNIVEKYFRIKYTNGSTEATDLSIQTQYSVNADTQLGHQLNETLKDETEAIIVRSVIVGQTEAGDYVNVPVSSVGRLKTDIPATAFGEGLVAQPTPVFQGIFEYTVDNTELTTNIVENGGTVTQATGLALIGTSTTTGSTACLQSKRHARYRSGQGGVARFTTIFTSPVAGTEQLIGLADETGSSVEFKNGYMIGYNGTTFGLHRFQGDTVTRTALSAWDDPLDGTGRSGMTIDLTKGNVWQIQFQYLGFGAIILSVEDDTTGAFVEVHRILYANLNTTPSVYNPNFHHTIWVNNKATTSDIVLKSASYAYFIEGKTKYQELHQPQQATGELQKTSVTTETAIFTIRNKTSYASKTNYIDVLIELLGSSIESSNANNLGKVRLVRNATLGGTPSYTDINTSDSVVDIDTAGTTVTGGKELVTIPLAGKNDKGSTNIIPFEIILAPGETITVAGSSDGSATINASLLWKELF